MKTLFVAIFIVLIFTNVASAAKVKSIDISISKDKLQSTRILGRTISFNNEERSLSFATETAYKPGMGKRAFPNDKDLWKTSRILRKYTVTCAPLEIYVMAQEALTADDVRLYYSDIVVAKGMLDPTSTEGKVVVGYCEEGD